MCSLFMLHDIIMFSNSSYKKYNSLYTPSVLERRIFIIRKICNLLLF